MKRRPKSQSSTERLDPLEDADWEEDAPTRRNIGDRGIRSSSEIPTAVTADPSLVELKCPTCGERFRGVEVCPRDGAELYALTERAGAPIPHRFDESEAADTLIAGRTLAVIDTEPPDDNLIGQTLDGRYRIVRRLGKGSMAFVYMAEQLSIKRKVAVKVLSPESGVDLADLNRRFESEAQIIARLTHPNTVRLFDYGRTRDGRPYFVTELLGGRSLEEVLRDGPLNSIDALEIMRQVARSLEEAHGLGIIHRDLKPANIFVDRVGGQPARSNAREGRSSEPPKGGDRYHLARGDALEGRSSERRVEGASKGGDRYHLALKILDFGVAKVKVESESTRPQATLAGTLLGTPAYMSPEQCLAEPVRPESDLYSLGAIAYHCLAGRPPFTGNTAALLGQHVSASPPPLGRRVPGLDPRIESLVMGLLSKDPAKRPSSAGALASHIDDLERSGTVFAVPVVAPRSRQRRPIRHLAIAIGLLVTALTAMSFMRPEPRTVPAGYVDAPVSDEVHDAFFHRIGEGKYGEAIALLEEANRTDPQYDTVYNVVAAYDAWGRHCPEVTQAIESFMKLCLGCARATVASQRFGRIYERCNGSVVVQSIPAGAKLWIDGVERGTTPSVLHLSAGKHVAEVEIGHDGRRRQSFETAPGRAGQLVIRLE